MAQHVLHTADSRGHFNHGWLNTYHTFSFADYYDPQRVHFGRLRVLNDDIVAPGEGFGMHPHEDMEVISIPLEGDLEHRDSLGHVEVIRHGQVQTMSAGTGIWHSEFNLNRDRLVKFLQIWVFPNRKGLKPRYDSFDLDLSLRQNRLQQVVSPNPDDEGAWIYQDAWFHIGRFEAGKGQTYTFKKAGNGVYAFILSGSFEVDGQLLHRRDGLGVWDTDSLPLQATDANSEILLIEVPMN
jgi:redox-sensitive bicupin YhaK (pirin superfamily)